MLFLEMLFAKKPAKAPAQPAARKA